MTLLNSLAHVGVLVGQPQVSRPVTDWPERLAATAGIVVAVAGLYLLMWRGWRRRAARQSGVPALPPVPPELGPVLAGPVDGVYVSTTREGDWLDRVVTHGLGVRSRAEVTVAEAGVLLTRQGAPDVFVPAGAVLGARPASGMAGKFVEQDGLFVVTWAHGAARLDTGFRARETARHAELESAVAALVGEETLS